MEESLLKETWIFEFRSPKDEIHRTAKVSGVGYSRFTRILTYAWSAAVIDYEKEKVVITFYKNRYTLSEQTQIYKEIFANYPSSKLVIGNRETIEITDPIEMVEFKLRYSE